MHIVSRSFRIPRRRHAELCGRGHLAGDGRPAIARRQTVAWRRHGARSERRSSASAIRHLVVLGGTRWQHLPPGVARRHPARGGGCC